MEQYNITGMSCAACQARVEKAVSKVPGVTECNVSLLTNSMSVEGTADQNAIIKAVTDAGYGAKKRGEGETGAGNPAGENGTAAAGKNRIKEQEEALEDHETPILKRRLILSIGFLLVLLYFSMGHMMFHFPIPSFFEGNHVGMGLIELILSAIVMIINKKFFTSGFKSLFHGAPNMDSLIALGSSAAFIYSTAVLFLMTRSLSDGDENAVMGYMEDFYFESAAMILTLITVGKMLEAYSKGKTTNALKSLMSLAPKTARVIREEDGKETEVEIPIEEVSVGDIFLVRPGENIPVDGFVIEGSSAVDESALTGESIPIDKKEDDTVSSATLNTSGFLKCRATRVGEDTTLSKIIQMVSDAASTKAPAQKLADKISGVFVPIVILIALVTILIWMATGASIGFSLARGICVLVVSCPCALGLATPVAIMVGNGVGAKNGILFKNAVSLQEAGNVKTVALDKTGTITKGEPTVTDVLPVKGISEGELLYVAMALESKSEHPLAKAVMEYIKSTPPEITDFESLTGNGLKGKIKGTGEWIFGGNFDLMKENKVIIPENTKVLSDELSRHGKTPLYFAKEEKLLGIIAVSDVLKEDSKESIQKLKDMGLRVVMLTGDNEETAKAIGKEAGVDEVYAGIKPDGKEAIIKKLRGRGKVAMVGDGINDAPALTRAEIGIAIGAGTDIAIEAADVVLMNSKLSDVPAAIKLSRLTYRNIKENLFWALIYNTLLIPTAAGALYHAFGIAMNPMLGALAMSLSSFCVVSNALRINLYKIH